MDIVAYKGGNVSYHDPYISTVKTNNGNEFISVDLSAKSLAKGDCVVLTTNHKDLDMELIQAHSRIIVDMRNMIKAETANVYKL